jgi:hypothetical protein
MGSRGEWDVVEPSPGACELGASQLVSESELNQNQESFECHGWSLVGLGRKREDEGGRANMVCPSTAEQSHRQGVLRIGTVSAFAQRKNLCSAASRLSSSNANSLLKTL